MSRRIVVSAASVAMCVGVSVGGVAHAGTPAPTAGMDAHQHHGARDLGAARGEHAVSMVLGSRDEAGLDEYVAHPHRPLSSAEYAQRFGPSEEAIRGVHDWAAKSGLRVAQDSNSQLVRVSGSTDRLGSAFGTSFHRFTANGHEYVSATTAAQLPAQVRSAVVGVVGIAAPGQLHLSTEGAPKHPATNAGGGFTPGELSGLYGSPQEVTGREQRLGIIGAGEMSQVGKDLKQAEQQNGLPRVEFNVVKVDGGSGDTSGAAEWALDSQASTGFAPDVAGIDMYAGPDLSDKSVLDTTAKWVDDNKAKQGSESLGECESDAQKSGFLKSQDELFKKAAAQGQTMFVSSGDSGSACQDGGPKEADYPAASPNVVAVGGTSVPGQDPTQQTAWDGSGGGESTVEKARDWQKNVGGEFKGDARGVPDVALDADPATGWKIITDGQEQVIGGTSASAPAWNGIWARAEEKQQSKLGFGAPLLYGLPPEVFTDITRGNNGAYQAAPGYDYTTGRGTPKIGDVVNQLKPTR